MGQKGGAHMPKLASLEAIETVADPRHRAILLAIRDTNLTLPKVADKVGIPYPTVHSIANRYLKPDFLRKRRLSCKSASTPRGQDTKTFVPPHMAKTTISPKKKPMPSRSVRAAKHRLYFASNIARMKSIAGCCG